MHIYIYLTVLYLQLLCLAKENTTEKARKSDRKGVEVEVLYNAKEY